MKLIGEIKETNAHFLAVVPLLDLREVAISKAELFDKLTKRIIVSLKELAKNEDIGEINIFESDQCRFEIKFSKPKYICALIIKKLRLIEKITQEKAAAKSCMVRTSYKQYEEGKREPSISKFNELVESFDYEWELTLKRKVKK